jgi:SAM-dependent methyltransferase
MRLAEQREPLTTPTIVWEECVCLLCGNANHTPVCEAADRHSGLHFLIVQCSGCGLCFTNPRPDPVSIARFYPHDYLGHQSKRRPGRASIPTGEGRARLLDFGCGCGDFLKRIQAQGWRVTGLDLAEAAVERACAQGLDAHVGTLPTLQWSAGNFDAITMWQSLEHTHQPLEVLRDAHRLLDAGGRLYVTVPNLAGFASRWFGSAWFGLDVPRHLTHFTPITLRRILAKAGFTRIELKQEAHNSWIRHSASGGLLATRLGSRLAGLWGRWRGQAEGIFALATK